MLQRFKNFILYFVEYIFWFIQPTLPFIERYSASAVNLLQKDFNIYTVVIQ